PNSPFQYLLKPQKHECPPPSRKAIPTRGCFITHCRPIRGRPGRQLLFAPSGDIRAWRHTRVGQSQKHSMHWTTMRSCKSIPCVRAHVYRAPGELPEPPAATDACGSLRTQERGQIWSESKPDRSLWFFRRRAFVRERRHTLETG